MASDAPTSIGICPQCRNPFEFETSRTGQTSSCPTCGSQTLLTSEAPNLPQPKPEPKKKSILELIGAERGGLTITDWVVFATISIPCALILLPTVFGHMSHPEAAVTTIVVYIFASLIYFIPALIGKRKENATAILLFNFFLGWTFIGWVVALVWAAKKGDEVISETHVKCPDCAELVRREARVCKHCGCKLNPPLNSD